MISLCKPNGFNWELCQDAVFESEISRGPTNMGPARRVAEAPFLIVTGEWQMELSGQANFAHKILFCYAK